MNVTIDKFGRVILPKALRQLLGLTPGKEITIEVTNEGFIATPMVTTKPVLVEENGFLFVEYLNENDSASATDSNVNLDNILEEVRNERIGKFLEPLK